MNSKKSMLLLVLMALIACFLLTGCAGLIKPSIGEISAAADEETAQTGEAGNASAEPSGSGEASGEASGETSGDASPEVVMEGNVVYRFEYTDRVSGSLGALSDLLIEIKLYDTPNANGDTYIISVDLGGSVTAKTGTWTLEDGTFFLRIDDFRSYESRDVDGVPAIVGVEYGSMMNRGTADVPLVEGEAGSFAPAAAANDASGELSAEPSGEASGNPSAS